MIDQALAWMAETGRGYKAAAKQFGVDPADLRAAKAGKPSRAPAPARDPKVAEPPEGISPLAWYRAELVELDDAMENAEPREVASLTKVRAQVVERLAVLEAQASAGSELADPATLLEAVVSELELSPHLLDDHQARRIVAVAETLRRMHDMA